MKKLLVTGGPGFLGCHLGERRLDAGHDVRVDNFFTGTKANMARLMSHPRFELVRHDLTFSLCVEVDEIYNLACPASPIYQFNDKTSVHGASRVVLILPQASADRALS